MQGFRTPLTSFGEARRFHRLVSKL